MTEITSGVYTGAVRVRNGLLVRDEPVIRTIVRDKRPYHDSDFHNSVVEHADENHKHLEHIDNVKGEQYNVDEHTFHLARDDEGNSFLVVEPRSEERSEMERRDHRSRDAGRKTVIDTPGSSNYGFKMLASPAELNAINAKRWE